MTKRISWSLVALATFLSVLSSCEKAPSISNGKAPDGFTELSLSVYWADCC